MAAMRVLVALFALILMVPVPAKAQEPDVAAAADDDGEDIVDVLGVGPVDLNKLPPELRDNFRAPGVADEAPPQQEVDRSTKPPDSEQEEVVPEEVLLEDIIRPSGESLSAEARREVRRYDNVRLPTPNAEVEAARRAWCAVPRSRSRARGTASTGRSISATG